MNLLNPQLLTAVGIACLAGGAYFGTDALTGVGLMLFLVGLYLRRD